MVGIRLSNQVFPRELRDAVGAERRFAIAFDVRVAAREVNVEPAIV